MKSRLEEGLVLRVKSVGQLEIIVSLRVLRLFLLIQMVEHRLGNSLRINFDSKDFNHEFIFKSNLYLPYDRTLEY